MTTKRKMFSKAFKEEADSLLEAGKQPPAEIARQVGIFYRRGPTVCPVIRLPI